ncbi:MAG: UDP-glucose 4-epimerase [uncultured Thermomicrobiales bacterium]|uniref:UDP-glucose 4-epimerase n=1 Tax=uncultured Thermomicrobiales bacterium TaxID=1645740 RepID=A0A6J4VEK4_9BACT|nr:MAG: UDP-glucose 4-epimerase [uncultured Thermomicrobiales bacterium]
MQEQDVVAGLRRVLLTGAAGRIGTAFREEMGARYVFRLADRTLDGLAEGRGHETLAFDIADLAACRRACAGIDTVVHLAADPSMRADFYESLLENNFKGTFNIFRAAADGGCRRVVFASSINAVMGYPADVQVKPDDPIRPPNVYGVSKCFGEALGRYFADQEGLSVICVRIGYYDAGGRRGALDPQSLSRYVSPRDLNQLLARCIDAPDVPFAIVHGLSENRFKYLDLTATRALLGYAPEDDAFTLFGGG